MKHLFTLLCLTGLMFASCGTMQQATKATQPQQDRTQDTRTTANAKPEIQSLEEYLRRVPGLTIYGSGSGLRVQVRGISSELESKGPLYVLNNVPVGHDYSQVINMVQVANIKRVEVLKDLASLNRYGTRGAEGVILIQTK